MPNPKEIEKQREALKLTILSEISKFPLEIAIIGRLIVGYGMLELALWRSLDAVIGNDDEATRIMFQRMGEMARLNVVEASIRDAANKIGLGEALSTAIKNTHKCREIRNKYAHAYWDDNEDFLRSAPLEKAAKADGDIKILLTPVTLELLIEQEERFIRCRDELHDLREKFVAALPSIHERVTL